MVRILLICRPAVTAGSEGGSVKRFGYVLMVAGTIACLSNLVIGLSAMAEPHAGGPIVPALRPPPAPKFDYVLRLRNVILAFNLKYDSRQTHRIDLPIVGDGIAQLVTFDVFGRPKWVSVALRPKNSPVARSVMDQRTGGAQVYFTAKVSIAPNGEILPPGDPRGRPVELEAKLETNLHGTIRHPAELLVYTLPDKRPLAGGHGDIVDAR